MVDVLIILALILLNGALSMSELAIVSARRMRLEKLAADGDRGARVALDLAEEPSRFLSTVQVGITLISIFNGAYGEASLTARLTPRLLAAGLSSPHAHELSLAIVVAAITLASILFGELVPKRIAFQHPEAVAAWAARPLSAMSSVMRPLVHLLARVTDFITHLLGMRGARDETPTEEEISGIIREGSQAGVLEKTEAEIVSRALRLDDRHLKALMTPRVDLELIDLDEPLAASVARIAASPYSRFPVYRGDRSQILGVIHARDLFSQAVEARSLDAIDLAAAVKPLLYVPDSVSAMDVLELFKENRAELALIVDEYGDIQGLVTLTDVMGALVGDVPVAGANENDEVVRREGGSWSLDAGLSLDRFRDLFDAGVRFPDEDEGHYHTLAGFVLYQLGYIPHTGEHLDWSGFRFEIIDMDGNRIDRLLVSLSPAAGETG